MLYVLDEESRDKLLLKGCTFICNQKIGEQNVFLFEDNKINFDKENIKIYRTNKMCF